MTAMTMNGRDSLNGVRHSFRRREMVRWARSLGSTRPAKCDADPEPRVPISSRTSPDARRIAIPLGFERPVFSGHLLLRLPCPWATPPSYFSCLGVARPVARGAPRAPRGSPPPPERSARGQLGYSPGPSFLLRRAPPTVRRATLRRLAPGQSAIARRSDGAS